jgi:uncharacterized damage-inducible protein DinB
MTTEEARRLCAYGSWANALVFTAAGELTELEAERGSFLDGLSDADLDRVVSFRNLAGEPYADPLDGLIRHVVNHSTYHRGQVSTLLRQLGLTPPNTDLITYLRQAR